MARYKVKQEINSWLIWDNDSNMSLKTVPTRKEARRVVLGLNAGWIRRDEMEKAPAGTWPDTGQI